MSKTTIDVVVGVFVPPEKCPRCGASPVVNATKNIRFRRLVWYQYQCGSGMHRDHGFAFDDGCTVTALRQCLVKVSRMRAMAKARLAVCKILKFTASSFHPNRKYCLPLYDESKTEHRHGKRRMCDLPRRLPICDKTKTEHHRDVTLYDESNVT